MATVVYGPGGYDPSKPNNNIVDTYEDSVANMPPPSTATPASIRVALRRTHGVSLQQLDAVIYQIINSMPDAGAREDAEILWLYAVEIERSHPLVAAIGSALNLTSQQIDNVFRVAANI